MASTALVQGQARALVSVHRVSRQDSVAHSPRLHCLRLFRTSTAFPSQKRARVGVRAAAAERPLWLPGFEPAKHLDGKRPGDFGFDPLNLGKDPAALRWYVQAELVHARFAMLGAAGILGQEVLRKLGRDIPIWYETGAAEYFAPASTLFLVQMLLFGWVETKRWLDFIEPGSQKDPWFFWIEPALEGLEPGYPGGPLFNISGFGTGLTKKDNVHEMRTKEIKNGRLAMVAVVGFIVQAIVTKTGPIENLLDHIADPWNTTVVETLEKAAAGQPTQPSKAPAVSAALKAPEIKASLKNATSKASSVVAELKATSQSLEEKISPKANQATAPAIPAPSITQASALSSDASATQAQSEPAPVLPRFGAASTPPAFCFVNTC